MHLKSQSKLTLAALMLALGSNRLSNVLAADDIVWRMHDVTLSASFALAALLALQLVPYSELRFKCLAAVVVGAAWVDLLGVAFSIPGYWYWLTAQALAGILLAALYVWRSYDQPSDAISDGRLYCLRTKPASLQDFLISLLGIFGPDGGYALYADGKLYRYRSGLLTSQSIDRVPLQRYHIQRGAQLTPAITSDLNKLVGKRWTWSRNCLTVLGPIWRRYRE